MKGSSDFAGKEPSLNRYWKLALLLVALAGASYAAWLYQANRLAARAMIGIASGNGRIEAVEIDVAARTAGRLSDVLVHEGDFVEAGQVVATMDVEQLNAQRREPWRNSPGQKLRSARHGRWLCSGRRRRRLRQPPFPRTTSSFSRRKSGLPAVSNFQGAAPSPSRRSTTIARAPTQRRPHLAQQGESRRH